MPDEFTYIKRYRMEMLLRDLPPCPELPRGFAWVPWREDLLDVHADVKFLCFQDEMDSIVFPSLGHRAGCHELMRNISSRATFVGEATWLIANQSGACATVQGLRDKTFGAIQNLGVIPEQRGRGLGHLLLLKALDGFRRAGLRQAYLEVTADNAPAVTLYRRIGFRPTRTIYKYVTPAPSQACVVI